MTERPIIMIGAGGHASVLMDLILKLEKKVIGITAIQNTQLQICPQIPYIGDDSALKDYSPEDVILVNGIGGISAQKNESRDNVYQRLKAQGYCFATLVHPSAIIGSNVMLGEGAQIMAGAIIQPNSCIGQNAIVNTKASIDHDCRIGQSVHVAPGVTLSGNVSIGNCAHIGVGATVIQGITIENNAMICAGATITKNVLSSQKVKHDFSLMQE